MPLHLATYVLAFCAAGLGLTSVRAFDNTRYDNVAVYWGQNSYGATAAGGSDPANWQKSLATYCQDSSIDAIPIAFVDKFFSTGNLPEINLANTCNTVNGNATFSGSNLLDCQGLAADIATCQSKGKIVTISLGGANGGVGFSDDTEATTFANTIWNLFLGGSSSTRPFGSAVLDGVDLDIEQGGNTGYAAFVNQIRTLSSGASKKYYVTAAPQCPYPDASLGTALNAASFDAVYVQFYNNQCGLNNYGTISDWDFGVWDQWARTVSPNPNVKVYIGAPASATASGTGYLSLSDLTNVATTMRKSFPSFGGVMLWDASQAVVNGNFQAGIKSALVAAGGTGFTYPACSAPAYVSGTAYTADSQVSYNGYIYEAKWWTQSTPIPASWSADWIAVSACGGAVTTASSAPVGSTTTTSPTTTKATTTTTSVATTSTVKTSTTSSTSATPTSGACASVAVWTSSVAYTAGQTVTYNGHLWTANWWTEADTPGGSAGSWTDKGACAGSKRNIVSSRFFRS